ncbi:hypothetical protein MAPG_03986, partial [Magnaporthiopsis poae ATCC 64411]
AKWHGSRRESITTGTLLRTFQAPKTILALPANDNVACGALYCIPSAIIGRSGLSCTSRLLVKRRLWRVIINQTRVTRRSFPFGDNYETCNIIRPGRKKQSNVFPVSPALEKVEQGNLMIAAVLGSGWAFSI